MPKMHPMQSAEGVDTRWLKRGQIPSFLIFSCINLAQSCFNGKWWNIDPSKTVIREKEASANICPNNIHLYTIKDMFHCHPKLQNHCPTEIPNSLLLSSRWNQPYASCMEHSQGFSTKNKGPLVEVCHPCTLAFKGHVWSPDRGMLLGIRWH